MGSISIIPGHQKRSLALPFATSYTPYLSIVITLEMLTRTYGYNHSIMLHPVSTPPIFWAAKFFSTHIHKASLHWPTSLEGHADATKHGHRHGHAALSGEEPHCHDVQKRNHEKGSRGV